MSKWGAGGEPVYPSVFRPEWMESAACKGFLDDTFHPDPHSIQFHANLARAEAKRICGGCPVKNECLLFGIEIGDRYGIYGGLTPGEREVRRKHRRTG